MKSSMTMQPANQIDLRIHDLERIEVLKGPQSTLYGEGSVGGTIRYITKDPELEEVSGNIDIDGSTISDGGTSQEIKGIVNIPLQDDLAIRLVGQYANVGGWIDQPALGKEDINDYELFNIRAKMLWQPRDNLEVKTTAIVHRNNTGAQNTNEDSDGNYNQFISDPSTAFGTDDYDFFNLLVTYDFGNMSLVSSTSYLDSDRVSNNHGSQCCAVAAPGELFHILYDSEIRGVETTTQEVRLSSDEQGDWHWSSGFFYKDSTLINNNDLSFGFPSGLVLFPLATRIEQTSTSWAIFGEAGYKIGEKFELGLGVRYFEDDREVLPGGTANQDQEDFHSVNPKISISYHANEILHLYINSSKGFRSGGFNVFQPPGAPTFDPESVWSYELGSKVVTLDGRISAEMALFFSDYEDYQTNAIVGGLNLTSNAGSAEIKGIDLSLSYHITENVEMGFSGNYMDTEFTDVDSTAYVNGDPLDMVPKYGYAIWSHNEFSWFDGAAGFFRLDYSEQGESHYRNRGLDDPISGLIYHSSSDVIRMLNARLGWERDSWSLELYGLNVLDEDGFIGPIEIERLASRPRPRTLGLKINYQF